MSAAALHARPRAHASLPRQAQLTATAGSSAGPLSPPDALSGALVCWHTHTVLAPALPAARAGGAPRSLGLWPLTWRAATGRGFDVAAQGLPGHWGRRRGDSPRVRGRVDGARWSCACRSPVMPWCLPASHPAAGCRQQELVCVRRFSACVSFGSTSSLLARIFPWVSLDRGPGVQCSVSQARDLRASR